jgi:hypothetical protein
MKAVWSSETSVNFYQSTRRYIPADSTRKNRKPKIQANENLKKSIISGNSSRYSFSETNLGLFFLLFKIILLADILMTVKYALLQVFESSEQYMTISGTK